MYTAWEEGVGEIIIRLRDEVICPVPQNCNDETPLTDPEIPKVINKGKSLFPEIAELPLVNIPAHLIPLHGEKEFRITFRYKTSTCVGLPVFDENTNGLDIIRVARMELDCNLRDLSVYDGESYTSVNGEGEHDSPVPINRPVRAYELDTALRPTRKILCSWIGGKVIETFPGECYPHAPVLKAVLHALSYA
jgi:hypothetical protein